MLAGAKQDFAKSACWVAANKGHRDEKHPCSNESQVQGIVGDAVHELIRCPPVVFGEGHRDRVCDSTKLCNFSLLRRQRPFLNMRSCLCLWACGLVKRHQSSHKYCSNPKFTSSQVQLKSPDVFLLRLFYR